MAPIENTWTKIGTTLSDRGIRLALDVGGLA